MNTNEMLSKAIALAAEKHKGQFDKAGKPYILHTLKVMHYTKSEDNEILCIAVLHDIVEDTDVTYAYLKEIGFSDRIVNAIKCLTKVKGETYEEYKQKVMSNKDSCVVKLADLRHNSDIRRLKGVTQKDIERTVKYHQFYTELKGINND